MKNLYCKAHDLSVEDIQKMDLAVSPEMMIALGKVAACYGDFFLSFGVEHFADNRNGKYYDFAEIELPILNKTFMVNADGEVYDNHMGLLTNLCVENGRE